MNILTSRYKIILRLIYRKETNEHWSTKSFNASAGEQLTISQQDLDRQREIYWTKIFANTDYAEKFLDSKNPDFSKIRRHFRFKWLWRVSEKDLRTQYTELLHAVLESMRASDDDQEIRDLNLVLYRQLLGEINRQVSEAPKRTTGIHNSENLSSMRLKMGPVTNSVAKS